MNLLLDTQLLIWMVGDAPQVSADARRLVEDAENDLVFSAASIWEIAIKAARGRADFRVDPRLLRAELLAAGFTELPVTGDHGAAVVDLPPVHKDPFDRLLVAQATVEHLTLLTSDRTLARYPGPILLV